MKKGFTMIELIFVIVILGILASVAIPRLAGTRADAEITATIANLRTLLSDVATYYIAKGSIENDTKFSAVTGVKLENNEANMVEGSNLQIAGENCVSVKFVPKPTTGNTKQPAYIELKKVGSGNLCSQVTATDGAVEKEFLQAIVDNDGNAISGATGVAVGASASVYDVNATN